MTDSKLKEICLKLMRADSEVDVISILTKAGYWNDEKNWRFLGDEQYNYSSVGNQQSRAEQAIVEKLVNSIDTKLMAAAKLKGIQPDSPQAPQSIAEARELFFGEKLKNLEELSRGIAVVATGDKPPGRPCFTIIDDGEGQTPTSMPKTILSLHSGNKDKIKFVQGKFNMGGTGVLEFCGMERNLQLVVTKRNPGLLAKPLANPTDDHWSFTIVRRQDPKPGEKSSKFTYLAPVGADKNHGNGELLNFKSDVLPIFPEKNVAYAKNVQWGTLIKLYEYESRRFGTNMMFDGLMYRVRLLLPEPALPIRFHECRQYSGHSGSFDTTMPGLVETLRKDIDNPKKDNVEWDDKIDFDVEGEKLVARIYVFKNKDAAESYRKDEGIIFSYNGQCHALLSKDFFRRKKVRQDYLWHSLLLIVDCSEISPRAHEKLFMNSRDRLRDGDLKRKIEEELEDLLGRHEYLKELASLRRKKELAEKTDNTQSMAKVLEGLLHKNPVLANLLGQGMRVKNPHKPEEIGAGGIAGFIGRRFPTKFHFKGQAPEVLLERDAHLNSHVRLAFETDAEDNYFKRDEEPGQFSLNIIRDGVATPAHNYQSPTLKNGIARISLMLPSDAIVGSKLQFEAIVNDPSRLEPFKNLFTLEVKVERPPSAGGGGGNGTTTPNQNDSGEGVGNKGSGQTQDSSLDIPEPNPVYEKDWGNHEPVFDKFTAMRIKRSPESKDNEEKYDYFINMDNVHLQTFLKAKPKDAPGINLRFSVGMTLVAMSLLHQDQLASKGASSSDIPEYRNSGLIIDDRVRQVTSAMAPFILPIIDGVSELEAGEDEALSASAGEVA